MFFSKRYLSFELSWIQQVAAALLPPLLSQTFLFSETDSFTLTHLSSVSQIQTDLLLCSLSLDNLQLDLDSFYVVFLLTLERLNSKDNVFIGKLKKTPEPTLGLYLKHILVIAL